MKSTAFLLCRFSALGAAMGLLGLFLSPVAVFADDGPVVVRGAEVVGGPVTPVTIHVDMNDLPPAPRWKPGDPVKEIPRRFFGEPRTVSDPAFGLPDPLVEVQRSAAVQSDRAFDAPSQNFDGLGYTGVNPPDPVGDVGPTYFIQAINSGGGSVVQIYNKDGSTQGASFMMESLGSGSCASGGGDPIVLWDGLAQRWVLQEFTPFGGGDYLCFYISGTEDPTEGTWHHYGFQAPNFPDYPHIGVWPDAYYTTTNEGPSAVYAFDRENMIVGNTARAMQRFELSDLDGYSFQAGAPADLDGSIAPPAGAPGYIMRHVDDEAHSAYPDDPVNDLLEIFAFDVDWATPTNSSLTQLPDIVIADYNSWLLNYTTYASVPQPGTTQRLDPIREVILNRLIYRNFGDHETLAGVLPTNIDEATSGTTVNAGLRWFELRKIGAGDWTLHQEGTYQPGDSSENRFVGSLAMDKTGNLALAYSFTDLDPAVEVGLQYTGQLEGESLNAMSQAEGQLVAGSGVQLGTERWGDYAAMAVDPADDCTFWFTGEYMNGTWATRISSFVFDACLCQLTLDTLTAAAVTNGDNDIQVSWNDSAVGEISEYRIYRRVVPGGTAELVMTVADSSPGVGGGAAYAWDDTTVSGGTTYGYVVHSSDGGGCLSDPSNEALATATGGCTLTPDFAGVESVVSAGQEICGLVVSWSAATVNCGGVASYNVYRSANQGFTPGPENLVAADVAALSYEDSDGPMFGETAFYVVRVEDSANGIEEGNTVEMVGTPDGPTVVGSWTDDAGDAGIAKLTGEAPWAIDVTEGNTGPMVYKTGTNPTDTCAALATPEIHLNTDALLTFFAMYDIEDDWDKGEVQISTDGGSTWERVPVDYPGHASNSGNDECNLPAADYFSGTDLTYTLYTASLSDWNDQDVILRWLLSTDGYDPAPHAGWWIDDIEITEVSVGGLCSGVIFSDDFEGADSSNWSNQVP